MNDPSTGVAAAVIEKVLGGEDEALKERGRHGDNSTVANFCEGLRRLKREGFEEWKQKERKDFLDTWQTLCQNYVASKQIICSTVGNATSSLLERVFRNRKHIVVIIDEASLVTESALWNVIANFISPERIKAEFNGVSPIVKLIIIGDEAQGYPLVKTEREGWNAFANQLALSPYTRLVRAGFAVKQLKEQFRMVPRLIEIPNQRWYGGQLRSSQERMQTRLSQQKRQRLETFFDIDFTKLQTITEQSDQANAQDGFLRLLLANVPQGVCDKDDGNPSRYNEINAKVIANIFKHVLQPVGEGLLDSTDDFVVLTFYNQQRKVVLNALLDMAQELGIPEKGLHDRVCTVDSFQGREAKYVILDTTVTTFTCVRGLGHSKFPRPHSVYGLVPG